MIVGKVKGVYEQAYSTRSLESMIIGDMCMTYCFLRTAAATTSHALLSDTDGK